jgi:hypothetical protein
MYHPSTMPSAKYTEVYKKVSQMGEKLKAAGKQGPSNDEQLSVRSQPLLNLNPLRGAATLPLQPVIRRHARARARFIQRTPLTTHAAVRLRQDRRGQGLCVGREARHVQPRCTYTPPHTRPHTRPHARTQNKLTGKTQGKAKYNKWQEQVNAGLSQKDAEAKYIELGEQLLAKHDN